MTIETKFKPGEKVWTIYKNRPSEMKIRKITVRIYKDEVYIDCDLYTNINESSFEVSEDVVFATKKELLDYWAN